MSNMQAMFRVELDRLLTKYELDKSVGAPSFILVDLLIGTLSNHQIAVKATTDYLSKDIRGSLLFEPKVEEVPERVSEPESRYLVFARTRALATEWAFENGIESTRWTYVEGMGTIKSILKTKTKQQSTGQPVTEYEDKILGEIGECLEIADALTYWNWISFHGPLEPEKLSS